LNFQTKYRIKIIVAILVALGLHSCQMVKYVPDNQFLLTKSKITVDNKTINKTELKSYLKQKPNTKILGFWRFHLGLYNLSNKKDESGLWKKLGEAPVIYNAYLTEKSKEEFIRYMQNKGYYQAKVTDTIFFKKNKKAEVYYSIIANSAHKIKSYETEILDGSIKSLSKGDSAKTLIKINGNFDTDVLAAESKRVLNRYQNDGFYRINKNEIYFIADTIKTSNGVGLKMIVDKENISDDPTILLERDHQRFTFRNFYFNTSYESQKQLFIDSGVDSAANKIDTVRIGNQYFISKGKMKYNPQMLMNMNHIGDKGYYNVDLVERTYNELFSLRLFKMINIRFTETGKLDSIGNPTLDCIIQLSPSIRQSYTVSLEGTNSLGNLGIAGNLGYQHKNIFRGGELLDVVLTGATEKQNYGKGDSATTFNSFETGIDTKITLPKFLAPLKTKRLFRFSTPQTMMNLSYNYQKRPDYTRTIIGASLGYQWKSSEYTTHRINLIDLNMVKMFAYDSAFVARIENLYIKSSYTDHSISAWNYTFTRNTQNIQKRSNYSYIRASFETAGTVLYGVSKLFDRRLHPSDTLGRLKYHFLGTPFAQYVKTDFEYRRGLLIDRYNAFVFRIYGGIAVPFGNSDQVPFERKYFTGGANGIRAWPVRTLGPGSFKSNPNEFPNQSGDIKLEANAEYRFAMIGSLEGALFVDIGNIWSLNDNRSGTEFSFSNFYKEIAIGSGAGLRYDFSFVILRIDLGIKLHDPALNIGNRWIPASNLLKKDNFNIAFAIGYPF
jgi:outer membrane protein assembly factor BamA